MAMLNWGMINGGGAFESLMHALVFAEDSTAVLFGRPGKDSGQDARSGDGLTVYQAKYYSGMDMARAVEVAHGELGKIKKYKDPTHPNFVHWKSVKHWVLVANIRKNPNDIKKWDEVVKAFRSEGFTDATYWGIEELEQLLYKHREISTVFFEGENRVLWGLHEAYEYLTETSPGKSFVDVDLIGRDDALRRTISFAEGEKRILPVVGSHGSGLSRFLYEVLVELSKRGWKTYWADTANMMASTKWFELLIGNDPTCLVVDDLDDLRLTQRIIGQLNVTERAKWKVIIGCHLENADFVLRPLATVGFAEDHFELEPLTKVMVNELVAKCKSVGNFSAAVQSIDLFALTQGFPGWLCLLLETCLKYPKIVVPEHFPEVVAKVIDSCVENIRLEMQPAARIVLKWLSAWEQLQLSAGGAKNGEFDFLHEYAGVKEDIGDVLAELVKCGLVRNWGVNKRCYAVEPAIFRQEILRDWLLSKGDGQSYVVSSKGEQFVGDMVNGRIYNPGVVLRTLSNMAVSYLEADNADVFLSPIFDAFAVSAKEQNTTAQYTIVDLLENVGWADPDRALEILKAVRLSPKENCPIGNPTLGLMEVSYADVMAKAGNGLFQYARCVRDYATAKRYFGEILAWCKAEDEGRFRLEWGNTCVGSLKKLLVDTDGDRWYQRIAYDDIVPNLQNVATEKSLYAVAESLLNPQRESIKSSHYSVTFVRGCIPPGCPQWNRCVMLRDMLFDHLCNAGMPEGVRLSYWRLLVKSHQAFSFAIGMGGLPQEYVREYRKYIEDELLSVLKVSKARGKISLPEFTIARDIWSWYLEYGDESKHPVALERQCEAIPHENEEWQFETLFKFCTQQEVQAEINRVAQKLESTESVDEWHGFFDLVKKYLSAARGAKNDLADGIRVRELASCIASHDPKLEPDNVAMLYVKSVLKGARTNQIERDFALQWCKDVYCVAKKVDCDMAVKKVLVKILEFALKPKEVLLEIFANVDPYSLGQLNQFELEVILDEARGFSTREMSLVLPAFMVVDGEMVKARLCATWDSIGGAAEVSACVVSFVKWLWLAVLRYGWVPTAIPMAWILQQILDRKLDGNIFAHYEMQELARRSGVRWGMRDFYLFIKTRLEIEDKGAPYAEFRLFPFEFNALDWCVLDDRSAFDDICRIALSRRSFVTLYELPKCLSQLDPEADYIAEFVEKHLRCSDEHMADDLYLVANLSAMCKRETTGWVRVLRAVCKCCEKFSIRERRHVYAGFQPKMSTGSWRVGTVPQEVIVAVEEAQKLFDAEPVDSSMRHYRAWVLKCAKEELRIAEARAEEERHDGA